MSILYVAHKILGLHNEFIEPPVFVTTDGSEISAFLKGVETGDCDKVRVFRFDTMTCDWEEYFEEDEKA